MCKRKRSSHSCSLLTWKLKAEGLTCVTLELLLSNLSLQRRKLRRVTGEGTVASCGNTKAIVTSYTWTSLNSVVSLVAHATVEPGKLCNTSLLFGWWCGQRNS